MMVYNSCTTNPLHTIKRQEVIPIDQNFIKDRIRELRIKKEVSEYRMSLDLGHSKGYVQSICSGTSLPSTGELLSICDYFGITPKQFFDDRNDDPVLVRQIMNNCSSLSMEDLEAVLIVVKRLGSKN